MSSRRTRKQKEEATHQYSYRLDDLDSKPLKASRISTAKKKRIKRDSIYNYDVGLIKKDLIKTVLVSLVLITLQLGVYWYL